MNFSVKGIFFLPIDTTLSAGGNLLFAFFTISFQSCVLGGKGYLAFSFLAISAFIS